SFNGSNGRLANRTELTAWATVATRNVWPSFAVATLVVPTTVPAPVTFSTITRCGNLLDNASASSRAATSVGPPAAKGTTRCSVVAGHDGACAEAGARPDGTKRAVIRKERRFICLVLPAVRHGLRAS